MLSKTVRTSLLVLAICVVVSLALKHGGDAVDSNLRAAPSPAADDGYDDGYGEGYDDSSVDDDVQGDGVLVIPVADDGHFYVDAVIGSTIVHFMVDTGATMVALSRDDADRLGFVLSDGDYFARVSTANGQIRVAPVALDSVRIDGNWMYDVDAVVIDAETPISLLGMSFLRNLDNFAMNDQFLTLEWN